MRSRAAAWTGRQWQRGCHAWRPSRRAHAETVRLGAVPAAVHVLEDDAGSPSQTLRVLETAVGCTERRAAVCESVVSAVPVVVSKMMKGGIDGAEAAVVCEGKLTKLVLLLQSRCSVAAQQMASNLLKIFRVNGKSCVAGYDSKTSHMMPF